MFSNFTEETCTGTGDTIALAGATAGNIQFSKSFSDGDVVAYSIEDSGGTIKVTGIGTYVSATDDITRNDNWSWNGTVVDNNPSTNVTLSGGTHTIRSNINAGMANTPDIGRAIAGANKQIFPIGVNGTGPNDSYLFTTTGIIIFTKMFIPAGSEIDAMGMYLATGVDASTTRIGIARIDADGEIGDQIAQTAAFNTAIADQGTITTALTANIYFSQGTFVYVWLTTDALIEVETYSRSYTMACTGQNRDTCDNRGFPYRQLHVNTTSEPAYPTTVGAVVTQVAETPAIFVRYL